MGASNGDRQLTDFAANAAPWIGVPMPTAPDTLATMEGELGVTGLESFLGRINEDYNHQMADLPTRMARFEEMYRSDGASAAMEALVTLPLLASEWDIKDGSDKYMSERIRENIFDEMTSAWDDVLGSAVSGGVLFGFCPHEKVFQEFDGFLGYRKFAERARPSVYQWAFDATGGIQGMQQWGLNPSTGSMVNVSIPIEKLMIWTWRGRLNNPEGMGVFRQAYKHHYYKSVFEDIAGMVIERQAMGIPTIWPPEDREEGVTTAEEAHLLQMLGRVRAGEENGLVMPSAGWKLEWSFGGGAKVDFEPLIELQDRYMLRSMLGQFMAGSGTYGASVDETELLLYSLRAVAKWVCRYFNKYALRQLVQLNDPTAENWSKGYKYPELRHGPVGMRDPSNLANILALLGNPRFWAIPDQWKDMVANELGFPPAPDGHWNSVRDAAGQLPEGDMLPPDSAVPPSGTGVTQGDGGGPGHAKDISVDPNSTMTETGGAPLPA